MEDVGICRDVIGCGFDGWICFGTGGSRGRSWEDMETHAKEIAAAKLTEKLKDNIMNTLTMGFHSRDNFFLWSRACPPAKSR